MLMKDLFAVFDTNVLVSALLSRRKDSATVQLLNHVLDGRITLLYNDEILDEYIEVLHRSKFNFGKELIEAVIQLVKTGVWLERTSSNEFFPDSDDMVFYEVALSKDGAFVVTGNSRHFPKSPIVVTPAEMIDIINQQDHS
ncbi:MAG: putative toxin-antitoxin system toxin component, PIN family [Prevotella sp.]|nr:putative toxin-antitoxin system toxin component, PIN family [Prevotella sp.]